MAWWRVLRPGGGVQPWGIPRTIMMMMTTHANDSIGLPPPSASRGPKSQKVPERTDSPDSRTAWSGCTIFLAPSASIFHQPGRISVRKFISFKWNTSSYLLSQECCENFVKNEPDKLARHCRENSIFSDAAPHCPVVLIQCFVHAPL